MKCVYRGLLASVVLVFGAWSVQAHADPSAWIGGLGGLAVPSADGTSQRLMWGLEGGAKLGSTLGLGLYYLTAHQNETINGGTNVFNYDLYGVKLGYYFEGDAKGVFFGAQVGITKMGEGYGAGGALDTSPFHFGVFAGYDHMFNDNFSLGGEANYISIAQSSGTVGGVNETISSFGTLDFLLSAKFWF